MFVLNYIVGVLIMALCLKHSAPTRYHPGNILFQTMLINSDVLLLPNMLDPLAIFGNSTGRFLHPPPCCKWIRIFRNYSVMLPFSSITLQLNILNISVLVPDLSYIVVHGIRALKISLPMQKSGWYTEINVQVRNKLPCDSGFANTIL
jgi:hypothetical protein